MSNNTENYGTLIRGAIRDFQFIFPEMTFGEVLYAFLRVIPNKPTLKESLSEIRNLTDIEIYNAIEKAIALEQEDLDTNGPGN